MFRMYVCIYVCMYCTPYMYKTSVDENKHYMRYLNGMWKDVVIEFELYCLLCSPEEFAAAVEQLVMCALQLYRGEMLVRCRSQRR